MTHVANDPFILWNALLQGSQRDKTLFHLSLTSLEEDLQNFCPLPLFFSFLKGLVVFWKNAQVTPWGIVATPYRKQCQRQSFVSYKRDSILSSKPDMSHMT